MFSGKKVTLAVTGSIAAYKSALLVRLLVKAGAQVRVVMTPAAKEFITPLTLATLSKNPVVYEFVEDLNSGEWNNHVELGMWGDLMVVAPCSANTLAKMAHGECDNLVMAVYLSAKCPVYIAPAMDLDMYSHTTTQQNIAIVCDNGNVVIPAERGELASGLEGAGRMAEPEHIIDFIANDLRKGLPLEGKKVLVTAGPTYEPIDPVRFIGNHSSGKMGFALAERAAELGAEVVLVSGPTTQKMANPAVELVAVGTAEQMLKVCTSYFDQTDILIMAAAVADYAPFKANEEKIKKDGENLTIDLKRTPDVLETLATQKTNQFIVGFALETNNELTNAKEKLAKKKLDMIVLNSLKDEGAGFGCDTNKITIIDKGNNLSSFELKSKSEVAKDVLDKIIELRN